jgi:hypothetical protein
MLNFFFPRNVMNSTSVRLLPCPVEPRSRRIFKHFLLKRGLWILSFLPLLVSCKTKPGPDPRLDLVPTSQYMDTVDKFSDRAQAYSGLFNTLDVYGTILNSRVLSHQTDQMARIYLWEKEKYDEEIKKMNQSNEEESRFFVSIYTPDRKYHDLNKSKNLWKIFLDVDGRRFEGSAKKMKMLQPEIQGFYHFHTVFSTPYVVTFKVPMTLVQKHLSKMTFTGPIGSASLDFYPIE